MQAWSPPCFLSSGYSQENITEQRNTEKEERYGLMPSVTRSTITVSLTTNQNEKNCYPAAYERDVDYYLSPNESEVDFDQKKKILYPAAYESDVDHYASANESEVDFNPKEKICYSAAYENDVDYYPSANESEVDFNQKEKICYSAAYENDVDYYLSANESEVDYSQKKICYPTADGSVVDYTVSQHKISVRRKKLLTKSQKRKKRRAKALARIKEHQQQRTEQPTGIPNAERTRQLGSNSSVPFIGSSDFKRPKMDSQKRSFSQTMESTKMAIVKDTYPSTKLNADDFTLIEHQILTEIDKIPVGKSLPKFSRTIHNAGAFILHCDDQMSVDWIRHTFNGCTLFHPEVLKVLKTNELPKPVKVAYQTKDVFTDDSSIFLRRMNRFNPELKSEGWRVLQKLADSLSTRWIFEINIQAADAIRKANYGAYSGLDWGTFKILDDPNQKLKEEEVVESEEIMTSSEAISISNKKHKNMQNETACN